MQVSTYCLGTMMFGQRGNPDHEDCEKAINIALDAGVNFIDTADVYSHGESEEIVGKALRSRRDEVVLATKVHGEMGDSVLEQGNSRRWIITEVENSMRRLGTDYIDLYQIHRPDPAVDIEETLSALTDLIHAGKVRAIGCSTYPADLIVEAHWAAERRGLERFRCEQPPYSIFNRGIERSILPVAERYGMGVIVYGPLASGWLSGRFRQASDIDMSTGRAASMPARFDPERASNQHKLEIIGELDSIATDAGVSLTHLAVAFTVSHPSVTSAIIGPRTIDQLQDLLAGADVELDDATLDRIDAVVKPGTDLVTGEVGWTPPALQNAALRRRPLGTRAAA
jgi:aryl-alcohol dehydrogenase-like predicted oxidoreductase